MALMGLCWSFLLAGCASWERNPVSPKPGYGYVDIVSPTNEVLYLEVAAKAYNKQTFKTVYSKLKAAPGGVLRLALHLGEQRLRVTVLNAVTEHPAEVDLIVAEGKVIPVQVQFRAGAETSVATKEVTIRSGLRGFGRNTTMRAQQDSIYTIVVTVQSPVGYQPKQLMPYYQAGSIQ